MFPTPHYPPFLSLSLLPLPLQPKKEKRTDSMCKYEIKMLYIDLAFCCIELAILLVKLYCHLVVK
jgi:hypothetical protein